MKRILAFTALAALILPTTAASHFKVMKPGTRFWVVTRPPGPTPNSPYQAGDPFNPYAICRHGIRGNPRRDPVFTTLGGYPLRFIGVGSPPRDAYLFSFSHERWDTRLQTFHASHQRPPDLQAKAVNPKGSRKVLFFWRCEHPG